MQNIPRTYYNENDPCAAEWLRQLIAAGLIPDGEVDARSIKDVQPDDLREFTHCHFFAGIGGWAFALQLGSWPADRPVWTGSCPCQPFSASGKQQGFSDERHLWPEFYRLIAECRPPNVLGEQTPSTLGREWLSRVRADLEDVGYAVGASDLCAACSSAPHIRQRLYWAARLEHSACDGRLERRTEPSGRGAEPRCVSERLGDSDESGSQGRSEHAREHTDQFAPWSSSIVIPCRDGKFRRVPIEPSLQPLAPGISGRVGILRGAGNAIVAQTAATFIKAFLSV